MSGANSDTTLFIHGSANQHRPQHKSNILRHFLLFYMLAGSLCLSPSESFLANGSWGSFFPPLGEVVLAEAAAACADWVGVVVDAGEVLAGVEGALSFEEWVGATVVVGICFGG